MHRLSPVLLAASLAAGGLATPDVAVAQAEPLTVGQMAPDFAIRGATRYGVLRDSVRLSDYRGKTVVLAFFFRARTRG